VVDPVVVDPAVVVSQAEQESKQARAYGEEIFARFERTRSRLPIAS
jgi:hypothetical protein